MVASHKPVTLIKKGINMNKIIKTAAISVGLFVGMSSAFAVNFWDEYCQEKCWTQAAACMEAGNGLEFCRAQLNNCRSQCSIN
jgi:hypothetical protein